MIERELRLYVDERTRLVLATATKCDHDYGAVRIEDHEAGVDGTVWRMKLKTRWRPSYFTQPLDGARTAICDALGRGLESFADKLDDQADGHTASQKTEMTAPATTAATPLRKESLWTTRRKKLPT
jgi:hypothetical protein